MKLRHKLTSYLLAGVMALTSVVTSSVMMAVPSYAASGLVSQLQSGGGSYYGYTGDLPEMDYAIAVYLCGDEGIYDGTCAAVSPEDTVETRYDYVKSACTSPGVGKGAMLMQYRNDPVFFFPTLSSGTFINSSFVEHYSGTSNTDITNMPARAIFSGNMPGAWAQILGLSKNVVGYDGSSGHVSLGEKILSKYQSYRQSIDYNPDTEFEQLVKPLCKFAEGRGVGGWADLAYKRYEAHKPVTFIFELYIRYGDTKTDNTSNSLWQCYHASMSYKNTSAWVAPDNSNLYGVTEVNAGALTLFGGNTFNGSTLSTNAARGLSPSYYKDYDVTSANLVDDFDPHGDAAGGGNFQGGWAYYSLCNKFRESSGEFSIVKDLQESDVKWGEGVKDADKKNFNFADFKASVTASYSISPIITLKHGDIKF